VTDRRQLEDAVEDLVGAPANAGVVESAPFLEGDRGAVGATVNLTRAFTTAQAVARPPVQGGVRGRLVLAASWLHARSQDPLSGYSLSNARRTALIAATATELPRTASS
jgi:NAD(P)-dependent dehydrogenase (short-subunit alcohol dehydrogenase family)